MQNGSGVVVIMGSELEARLATLLEPLLERVVRRVMDGARLVGPVADLAGEIALAMTAGDDADDDAEPAPVSAPVVVATPKAAETETEWIHANEVAVILGIGAGGVSHLARAGVLRTKRDGASSTAPYYYDRAQVMERAARKGRAVAGPAPSMTGSQWMSKEDTADELDLSPQGVNYLRKAGELKSRKKPNHVGRGGAPYEYDRASVLARKAKRAAMASA
jgi:hypothetical protein